MATLFPAFTAQSQHSQVSSLSAFLNDSISKAQISPSATTNELDFGNTIGET